MSRSYPSRAGSQTKRRIAAHARDRAQAVAYAYRQELAAPGDSAAG